LETAADIEAMRTAANAAGKQPFIIAKIERLGAIMHFDVLAATDGIMVARGDLGVEVPIEEMAILQKQLIARARIAGKPVITATQMLESMVASPLPTRAGATNVANAILDGTDAVMLSAESAMGKYPVEAVAMLAKIAAYAESQRPQVRLAEVSGSSRLNPIARDNPPGKTVNRPRSTGRIQRSRRYSMRLVSSDQNGLGPKPGDFPIGSVESRAAARAGGWPEIDSASENAQLAPSEKLAH
jgi:hypothetical protein